MANQQQGTNANLENSPGESPTASNSHLNASVVKSVEELEQNGLIREVGSHAVWSLSSCKSGFGVGQLRWVRSSSFRVILFKLLFLSFFVFIFFASLVQFFF